MDHKIHPGFLASGSTEGTSDMDEDQKETVEDNEQELSEQT